VSLRPVVYLRSVDLQRPLHPQNAFQACDVFADLTGWPVVSPDFFRGKAWIPETMESLGGLAGMTEWAHAVSGKGPWEGLVGPGNWEAQVRGEGA